MATRLSENSITGDLLVFDDIIQHAYRGYESMDPVSLLREMVNDGVLQIETLFEKSISMAGNLERESTEGRDFVDGSDAKKCKVQWCHEVGVKSRRVATVTNIVGKHGILRVIVAETLTGKTYYFKIPKHAYQGLTTVRIYFNEDGTPKNGKCFDYECEEFKELCN